MKNVGNSSRGRSQGVMNIFRAPYRAHCAVIFATAQLSCITGVLFCDQKTSFSQIRLRLRPDLSSEIRPNSALAGFEKVKFGATLDILHKLNLHVH